MFKWFKKNKDLSNQEILQRIELRFCELSAQVKEVELSVKELETKLLTKDLRDKQIMGAFHYKLHEKKAN